MLDEEEKVCWCCRECGEEAGVGARFSNSRSSVVSVLCLMCCGDSTRLRPVEVLTRVRPCRIEKSWPWHDSNSSTNGGALSDVKLRLLRWSQDAKEQTARGGRGCVEMGGRRACAIAKDPDELP